LEESFSKHPKGILLEQFVKLMKTHIPHKEHEKYDLVHGLCKLFKEIDINGDGHMEWQEFTQYIIDEVMQNPNKISEEQLKSDQFDENTKMDLLEVHKKYQFKRYFASLTIDKSVHNGFVERAKYCPGLDGAVLTIEDQTNEVKLQDLMENVGKVIEKFKPTNQGFVMDADYSEEFKMIGCVTTDSCMYFYTRNEKFFEMHKCINAPSIQTIIRYLKLAEHKYWATAGKDRILRIWNPLFQGSSGS
jgi:hypothetical protein